MVAVVLLFSLVSPQGAMVVNQEFLQRIVMVLSRSVALNWLSQIDRYILNKYLSTYFFLLVLIITIAIIFDFNENIDKITNGGANGRRFSSTIMPTLRLILPICSLRCSSLLR